MKGVMQSIKLKLAFVHLLYCNMSLIVRKLGFGQAQTRLFSHRAKLMEIFQISNL